MAYQTFAAIDVGSNDIAMKIYQISGSKGIKRIDYVSQYLGLGSQTYKYGKINNESVDALCMILNRFKNKMREYQVSEYQAYATSAIREAANREVILDQIFIRTGMEVKVVSNSERHFIMYKGIASGTEGFNRIIQKNTAILDMGAGSVQLSVFEKESLATTQNLKIGPLRLNGLLEGESGRSSTYRDMLSEYIGNEMDTFSNYYLKDKQLKNLIAVGDEIDAMKRVVPELKIEESISSMQLDEIYATVNKYQPQELASRYDIPQEIAETLLPAAEVYRSFLDRSKAELIYTPGIDFCDSIVADYTDNRKIVPLEHDFGEDIISISKNISKRYHCNRTHISDVAYIALEIFDEMKKIHGLSDRQRLYLHIAIILHDCGKYINMVGGGVESYNIIMSSEIIGLSHHERWLVANIVKYNTLFLPGYTAVEETMAREDYILIAKLTAIIRIANALDRSHKQKISRVQVVLKNKKLVINTDTVADISLEKTLLVNKAQFFEEVYGIKPVVKQRRAF